MEKPKTRKSLENELVGRGVSGKALECLLKETAGERRRSRAAYARWAAEEYWLRKFDLPREEVARETLNLVAGAILWADVIGIGGYDGVEGASTARHPAFDDCGKGRKQAIDGEAWSDSIYDAACALRGPFAVKDDGSVVFSLPKQNDPREILIDEIIMPAAWIRSIIREGLRRATCSVAWHPNVSFDAPPESAQLWARAYNKLVAKLEAAA